MELTCPYCKEEIRAHGAAGEEDLLIGCGACFNAIEVTHFDGAARAKTLAGSHDVREIATEGSIGGGILRGLPGGLEDLPVLPEISQRVIALTSNPNVSMKELAGLIREDQIIAATVLKGANSAVYGGLHRVTELDAARTRLGMRTIANIVQTAANGRLFRTNDPDLLEMMKRLWRHSVVTAYCANELAVMLCEPRPDAFYLGGLFHDIGKIALIEIVSGSSGGPIGELRGSGELLGDVLANYHCMVGLHVVQKWALPNEFRLTTYFHDRATSVPVESWSRPVHIVSLANMVAKACGFSMKEDEEKVSLLGHPSSAYLNMTDIKLANLRVTVEEKFESLLESFE